MGWSIIALKVIVKFAYMLLISFEKDVAHF